MFLAGENIMVLGEMRVVLGDEIPHYMVYIYINFKLFPPKNNDSLGL